MWISIAESHAEREKKRLREKSARNKENKRRKREGKEGGMEQELRVTDAPHLGEVDI